MWNEKADGSVHICDLLTIIQFSSVCVTETLYFGFSFENLTDFIYIEDNFQSNVLESCISWIGGETLFI